MWLRFKINFIVIQHYLKDAMQNEIDDVARAWA